MTPTRLVCTLLAISACGCGGFALGDPANTPCIFNGCRVPITFIATFSDGASSSGSLPPGSDAWQRIKGRHLRSLSVVPTGAARHVYTESTLDGERSKRTVTDELWVVSEHGIRLEDRRQIEVVRKLWCSHQ